MKTSKSILMAVFALLSFTLEVRANQRLEGIWENQQNRIILTIESTSDGIRVKRSGQNRWYTYHQIRENQFRDGEGNVYYLNHDNSLEWEDRNGKKRIRFFRRQHNPSDRAEYRHPSQGSPQHRKSSTHIERNHHYGRSGRYSVGTHELQGKWINATTGQAIQIQARNNQLKVRANREGWVTFRRSDANTFIDRRGNRYDFIHNRLVYTSRNGDFRMEFSKY